MKKILLILLLSVLVQYTKAQCNEFYALKKGTAWQISNFNAKEKYLGKTIQTVKEYKKTASGFEATIEVVSEDDKGEQYVAGATSIKCEDGIIFFNLEDMFPDEAMKSIENFEVKVDGTNLELPDDLKVGQTLKDAELTMQVDASPLKMTFIISVTNRVVEAQENLKVPAGSFDCYKIKQNVNTKTMVKVESNTIEWYAKGVGMIKSETYNKKGKLVGYSLLSAYKE